jgi:ferredoxin
LSLFDAAERFASIDRSQVVLDTKHCLHSLDQYSDCTACFTVCPAGAITTSKPPVLNTDQCQSCLACIPVCPVSAYRADDDVSSLLNCLTHVENKSVELLCGYHPNPETGTDENVGIRIHGCLAGLGTGAYLTISALGMERIIVRADACAACKWHSLGPNIRHQIERANHFLSAWNRIDSIVIKDAFESPVERPLWDAKNPPLSRRDLFRMMARQSQVAMARAMENGLVALERQPGRDRLRLLSAVAHLEKEPSAKIDLHQFDFAALTISGACTACGVCARICPTDALHFEKNPEGTEFSITFSPKNCIACDLCAHVCQPDAIRIEHEPVFEQIFGGNESIVLQTGQLVRCERCHTPMAAREGVRLCPLCEYRRKHPFGSLLPGKPQKALRS